MFEESIYIEDLSEENKYGGDNGINWLKIGGIVILVIIVILLIIGISDSGEWGEWVLEGPEPTCGSGTKKYKRSCSINSIASALGRTCVPDLSGNDTKTLDYNIPGCVIGRYIILERISDSTPSPVGDDNALNIAEINIKGKNGVNLVDSFTTAEAGSVYANSFKADNLIDGNLNTMAHTTGGASAEAYKKQWFKIDLKENKNIELVEIINRNDCCQYRINGTRVRIINSNNADVFTSPVIKDIVNDNSASKLKFTFVKV